jgi:hypothetical protein
MADLNGNGKHDPMDLEDVDPPMKNCAGDDGKTTQQTTPMATADSEDMNDPNSNVNQLVSQVTTEVQAWNPFTSAPSIGDTKQSTLRSTVEQPSPIWDDSDGFCSLCDLMMRRFQKPDNSAKIHGRTVYEVMKQSSLLDERVSVSNINMHERNLVSNIILWLKANNEIADLTFTDVVRHLKHHNFAKAVHPSEPKPCPLCDNDSQLSVITSLPSAEFLASFRSMAWDERASNYRAIVQYMNIPSRPSLMHVDVHFKLHQGWAL